MQRMQILPNAEFAQNDYPLTSENVNAAGIGKLLPCHSRVIMLQ